MNIFKTISLTCGAFFLGASMLFAQPMQSDMAGSGETVSERSPVNDNWSPSLVPDGAIQRSEHVNRVVEWAPIREIDVAWKVRVWREIDVRQKQNQAFIYPGDEYTGGGSFIEIILDLVKRGRVAAYSVVDDHFSTEISEEELEEKLGDEVIYEEQTDPITFETIIQEYRKEFDVNSVVRYEIKEDVIFDRNIGRSVTRIIGICPIKNEVIGGAEVQQEVPIRMFWLYYPELRNHLVHYEVYNPGNMMKRMTWTDLFDNRYFSSYIIKTSLNNPRDVRMKRDEIRSLHLAEQFERQIAEKEMDMWEN